MFIYFLILFWRWIDTEIYGYHRTSTKQQHLDRGIAEIETYCKNNNLALKKIFTDQQSGKTFDRLRYTVLKEDILRKNDILIVSELDRLGRDKASILEELRNFKEKGIRVMILEIPTTLADYSSMDNSLANLIMETVNNLLIEMYAAMAQAELEKKSKRQQEGIQAKKDRDEWDDYGRPKAIDLETFVAAYKKVEAKELRAVDCIRELGLTKPTFYRYRKYYLENNL